MDETRRYFRFRENWVIAIKVIHRSNSENRLNEMADNFETIEMSLLSSFCLANFNLNRIMNKKAATTAKVNVNHRFLT